MSYNKHLNKNLDNNMSKSWLLAPLLVFLPFYILYRIVFPYRGYWQKRKPIYPKDYIKNKKTKYKNKDFLQEYIDRN